MASYGVNVIRVRAEQGDLNPTGDYHLEYPAGTCRPSQEGRLDELFNAADQYGVYVMICPWDTFNIKSLPSRVATSKVVGAPKRLWPRCSPA
jgi:hypothetical protein